MPIYPYLNTSVLIGIGQRYNVIVEANPMANGTTQPVQPDGNYWMRTWVAPNCGSGREGKENYERTGILRYDSNSKAQPKSTNWSDISLACSDETYTSLRPVLPWIVGDPINNLTRVGQQMDVIGGTSKWKSFPDAFLAFRNATGPDPGFTPLQINFSDPIFLHLDNTEPWEPLLEVVPEGRSNKTDWVSTCSH